MTVLYSILAIVAILGGAALAFVRFEEEPPTITTPYGNRRPDPEWEGPGPFPLWRRIAGAVLALAGVVCLALAVSVTTVDARSVGIETRAGRYVDTLKPGRHYLSPIASVEQWTTRNQTMVFEGGDGNDGDNRWDQPTVPVRFATQGGANIDVTVTWAITDTGSDFEAQKAHVQKLWNGYKSFDQMAKNLVSASIVSATGDVFSSYNPFQGLDEKNADNPIISNGEWSKRITSALLADFNTAGITLVKVQVTFVHYDGETEAKLKAFAGKIADTRIAQQDVEIAKQQALASKERATQAAPGCEALIRDLAAANQLQNLPAGWQCPGASGGGVIVGQK